jgi:hypothetical protein
MATLLRIYYEHSRICHVRSIALLAVKTCSKAILALRGRHGKSPCFLGLSVLRVVGVDGAVLDFAFVNGANLLE